MAKVRAVLLDVFDTIVTVDFEAALDGLAEASGLPRSDWAAGWRAHGRDVTTGGVTSHEAFTATFRMAGKPPGDIDSLVARDLELLREHARLYPDVLPFMEEVRGRGIALALVSNCFPNTGPLLDTLGLTAGVDHVTLSCDIGSAKPDGRIFGAALDALRVDAADALFVDDQAAYCAGAEVVGMRAVRIDRRDASVEAVHSLLDILPML